MPVNPETKAEAKKFVDLIKKSKGSLKVYFAVGKDKAGEGIVHVDKKKAKACIEQAKKKGMQVPLASGQVTFEDKLTLCCMKEPNANGVKKAFAHFFKACEVTISGVTESSIIVLGPKEWNVAAAEKEEEGPETEGEGEETSSTPLPPTAPPPPPKQPESDPGAAEAAKLKAEWLALRPQMQTKVTTSPELKDPLMRVAKTFEEAMRENRLGDAKKTLSDITELIHKTPKSESESSESEGEGTSGGGRAEIMKEWNALRPKLMERAGINPALREPASKGAKALEEAIKANNIAQAKQVLEGLHKLVDDKSSTETTGGAPDATAFSKRYEAIKGDLSKAVKEQLGDVSRMRSMTGMAIEKANAKDFVAALKILDNLEKVVAEALASKPGSGADQPVAGLVEYRKKLLEFDAAKKATFGRIAALAQKIAKEVPDEEDFADELEEELRDLIDEVDDAIILAMNASKNSAAPVTSEVRAKITQAANDIRGSELVKKADTNPLQVPTDIASTLGTLLDQIAKAMPVAA